jgi:hypothetical protein
MDRRELLEILLGTGVIALVPDAIVGIPPAQEPPDLPSKHDAGMRKQGDALAPGPKFEWLGTGEIKPAGWIREQMLRDLRQGFAGCLDKLCQEARSDIFVSHRNSKAAQHIPNAWGENWWNGETEGNWRAGHMMMAYLAEEPNAMREADRYVQHVLGSQDADGYLGVFAPDSRYIHPGELWTQACLLRGLLAYAELTSNPEVLTAVRRAADLSVKVYSSGQVPLPREGHDLMFIDVMERLFDLTGDPKYRDFSLWFYVEWSKNEPQCDAALSSLLDIQKGFVDHGAHTYENIRVPLWLGVVTGRRDIRQASENAFAKISRYSEVCGSGVSEEFIMNLPPDPSLTEYEYCSTKELQLTFASAMQKTGHAAYGDRVESIWFNAAQGSRLPNGTAVSYLTPDNRFRCDETVSDGEGRELRNKFSPTHSDVAVCCNPNATQVAALFVHGMWMRHREGGLVALLYGPCVLSTKVNGIKVQIEQQTLYPFENTVEVIVRPDGESTFPLYFRNPGWSGATKVICAGAAVERQGDCWRVTKHWKAGDSIHLEFTPEIREIQAVNGDIAIQYGALIFAQPLPSEKRTIKHYSQPGFEDSVYTLGAGSHADCGVPARERANAFRPVVASESTLLNPLYPFDTPRIELRGHLISKATSALETATLVPMGNAPLLRRVTFPVID